MKQSRQEGPVSTSDRTHDPLGFDVRAAFRTVDLDRFCATLKAIERAEESHDYDQRNRLVIEAVAQAQGLGFLAGYRIDTEQPAWPVAVIELVMPDGSEAQVSWHLPEHPRRWDGHDTDEKYRRVHAFTSAN
jgi:hypothetical protein